jgi:hypothetical protein
VAIGGLSGDQGVDWWLYPLLLAPILQLGGAIALLTGRSWRPLALACLPATAFFGYLLYQLGAPLLALLLVLPPSPRRWAGAGRLCALPAEARGAADAGSLHRGAARLQPTG